MTFSDRLREARERSGLRKSTLGSMAGLSSSLVGILERNPNANPRLETIVALAKVLGVPVQWLAAGSETRDVG